MKRGRSISQINRRLLSVGFPLTGGKTSYASLNRSVITLSIKLNLDRVFAGWAGAVDDCNDEDQSNCVGSGKLGELGAFGDTAKSVCGHDGN
jgi:hypothetical protein